MPRTRLFRRGYSTAGLLTVGCVLALSLAVPQGEALLDRGFDNALDRARSSGKQQAGNSEFRRDQVWLSGLEQSAQPLTLLGPLALGDRITIAGSLGEERVLHVEDISEIAAPTRMASADEPRLLMVTCRVAGQEDAKPVRFIIEAEDTETAAAVGSKPRVL